MFCGSAVLITANNVLILDQMILNPYLKYVTKKAHASGKISFNQFGIKLDLKFLFQIKFW